MTVDEYRSKIKSVLITEEEIKEKLVEAGKYIDALYDGRPILLVGILKGSFVFLADLCRSVSVPCEIAFMKASSYYNGTISSGTVKISLDIDRDISGYHVVIAEDIIDTGRTLSYVASYLKSRNPLSFHIVTLLDKPERRTVEFEADYALFTIPDKYVIGYGLDCAEKYRELPYVAEYCE